MFQESPFSGACAISTLEVLLMLVGTLLLGLLLGYLIWGWVKSRVAQLEKKVSELAHIVNLKDNQIADLNTRALSIRKEADKARGDLRNKETQYATAITRIKDLTDEVDTLRHAPKSKAKAKSKSKKSAPPADASAPEVVSTETPAKQEPKVGAIPKTGIPAKEQSTGDKARKAQALRKGSTKASLAVAAEVFGKKITANDLKIIEGIGPKISEILNGKGIKTWARLAQAKLTDLRKILEDAGPRYRLHDPKTWSRQARMAAKGEWKKLKAYQDTLRGGRPD